MLILHRGRRYGLQVVGTRGAGFSATRAGDTGGRSDVQMDCRAKLFAGRQVVSDIRVAFTGVITPAAAVETNLGNDYTAECALERVSPSDYELFRFGGATSVTVPNGGLVISDPLATVLTPNQQAFVRTGLRLSSTSYLFPQTSLEWVAGGGDFRCVSAAASSQVAGTGAMSIPSGGTNSGVTGIPYYMVLGRYATPTPAVAIWSDSNGDGAGDTQVSPSVTGAIGFAERALDGVNGYSVPYTNFSVSSNRLEYSTPANSASRFAVLKYFTHLIIRLGNNDVGGSRTLEQMQADFVAICEGARQTIGPYGNRIHITACTLGPRTSSTDSWLTVPSQTPVAGFGPGETRDQFNDYLRAQAGILFDELLDTVDLVFDQGTGWAWLTAGSANPYAVRGTGDGLHFRSDLHIAQADRLRGIVKMFRA